MTLKLVPSSPAYPWASVAVDDDALLDYLAKCVAAKIGYRLGAKAPALNARPGEDFTTIDCSGFARVALHYATHGGVLMPDGSANQYEWCVKHGMKQLSVESAKLCDGVLRVAFLLERDADPGAVGVQRHVAFVLDAQTIESCGRRGPCRREWTGEGWQAKSHVFALTRRDA